MKGPIEGNERQMTIKMELMRKSENKENYSNEGIDEA